jgi:hypothetical protein
MATHLVDKVGKTIHIGDKFIKNNTTEIYQVVGISEDGRIRAQEAVLNFGGNPYAAAAPYGSTKYLLGPVYLFLSHQIEINKEWSK